MNFDERDFILRIDSSTPELCIALSRHGTDGQDVLLQEARTAPFPTTLGTDYLRPLANHVVRPLPEERLKEFGRLLAERVLPEEIRALLFADRWKSTRLRLMIDASLSSLEIPWEYLYLDEDISGLIPKGFLCQLPNFHLIRQSSIPRAIVPVAANPLNVLVAWADPQADGYAALPFLHTEVDAIKKAFSLDGHMNIEEAKDVGPVGLKRRLRPSKLPFHILHFIGHGETDRNGSALILQGEGGAVRVSADEFANWLRSSSVRLVVLSACRTAAAHGIAQTLTQQGVPAVVAMQLPWRDDAAAPFARILYTMLAQQKSVEEAVHEARQVLPPGVDRGVPTLHLAGNSGVLFDFAPALPPGPIRLPFRHNPRFVGRDRLMDEIHQALMASAFVPTTLVGLGGIGKTQLATEYALKYQHEYPNGIFWFDARTTASLLESYADYGLSDFQVSPDLPARLAARKVCDELQKWTRPALLIYDNLNYGTRLEPLPVVGPCRILVTTREGWLVPREYCALPLPDLDSETALELLLTPEQTYSEAELVAARDLVEKVGRLPLALALIARPAAQEGFLAYRDRFVQHRIERLEQARRQFVTSTKHNGAIFDTIDISYQRLDASAQTVLHTAACFAAEGISRVFLCQACPVKNFDAAVLQLQDFSLLSPEEKGRFTLHELVRVFAQGRMPEAERSQIVKHVSEMWTRLLTDVNPRKAWKEARPEIAHFRVLAELCGEEWAENEQTVQEQRHLLLLQMAVFLAEQDERDEAVQCLEVGLKVVDSLYPQRNLTTAAFLQLLSQARQGDGDRKGALAYTRQALKLARAELPSNSPEWAEFLLDTGYLLRKLQHLRLALICYRAALPILEAAYGRQHQEIARVLNMMGAAYEHLDILDLALQALNESIAIQEQIFGPDSLHIAIPLNNRGPVLGKMGQWKEAQSDHRRALAINESNYLPDHTDVINSCWLLADACYELGEYEEARTLYHRVLPILQKIAGREHPYCKTVREKLRLMDEATDQELEQNRKEGEETL